MIGIVLNGVWASLSYRINAQFQKIAAMPFLYRRGSLRWRQAIINQTGRRALKSHPPDYSLHHLAKACTYKDPSGAIVLVVGCNRGYECRGFVEFGASKVIGIDVMPEIGESFVDPRVEYYRMNAEKMSLPDSSVDIVFCFATMEHIPNIEAAFREMLRVCRPGGIIYCIAAPLWRSRGGPHWGDLFNDTPWPHLRWPDAKIIEAGVERGLSTGQMQYWIGDYCNRRPASDYVNACAELDVDVIRNALDIERQDADPAVVDELLALGFSREELFASQHVFVARKPG